MKKWRENNLLKILWWLALGLAIRLWLQPNLEVNGSGVMMWIMILIIIVAGVYLILQTAEVIEKTTGVLKDRTGLAGLQAFVLRCEIGFSGGLLGGAGRDRSAGLFVWRRADRFPGHILPAQYPRPARHLPVCQKVIRRNYIRFP